MKQLQNKWEKLYIQKEVKNTLTQEAQNGLVVYLEI